VSFALNRAFPFVADSLSFFASAVLVSRLPSLRPTAPAGENVVTAIKSGLRHLYRTPDLRFLAFNAGAYNFAFNASMAIFVLYVHEILKLPFALYGVLLAVGACGGALAGWKADTFVRHLSYRQTMAIACLAQGGVWAGIAITANAWMTGIFLIAIGAGAVLGSVATSSAWHALTPDGLVGRVVSGFRLISAVCSGLGALTGGVVAGLFGLTAAMVLSICVVSLTVIVTWPLGVGPHLRLESRAQVR
jgi:Na+/melibiose symporter-like transporter